MKRLVLGVTAAVVALSFAMAGCDKKIQHSESKIEDIKGSAQVVLLIQSMRDATKDENSGAPSGAKVIASARLFGNEKVVQTVNLSGKSVTLTLPVQEEGTSYTLRFPTAGPDDYKNSDGETKKYYYEASETSVLLHPGDKEVKIISYSTSVKAE